MARNRNNEISLEQFKQSNTKLFFFNLLVIVLSVVCAGTLLLKSFWKIEFSAKLDSQTINEFLGENAGEFDLSKMEQEINFSIAIDVSPKALQDALVSKSDKERVKRFLNPVVSDLQRQVKVAIKSLVSVVVQMGIDSAMTQIQDQISDASAQKVKNMDITPVNDVMESAFSGELTNEMAKTEIFDILNSQIHQLDIPQEEKDIAIASVEENLETMFDQHFASITDEKGFMDPSIMVENMLGEMLGLKEGEFGGDDVLDKLVAQISPKALNGINIGIMALAITWAVCIGAWFLLAVFATFRLVLKRKGASFFLARLVGWIPGMILWVIPTLALILLKKNLPADMAQIFDMFKVTFSSVGGMVSLFGAVLLMLFGWFGYKKAKRITKKYRD